MDLKEFSRDRKIEERKIKNFERRKRALLTKNRYFNKLIENEIKYLNECIGFLSPMNTELKNAFAEFILHGEDLEKTFEKIIFEKITRTEEIIYLLRIIRA